MGFRSDAHRGPDRSDAHPELKIASMRLPRLKTKNGRVVFELPSGAPPLTNEKLDELERAEYDEEYRRALSPRSINVDQ